MSKQLHKNFTDGQVKSLFEKYSKGEIKLNYILSCQFLESREVDSLNYWPNIEMTQITFLSSMKGILVITESTKKLKQILSKN